MKRRYFILSAAGSAALMSCERSVYKRATQAEVRQAFYHHDGPPSISVFSMISTRTDTAEHTGILISCDQRVLYDPAGSFDPSKLAGWTPTPRKDDIHYGMTDRAVLQYEKYHARLGYYVLRQTIQVPLNVANLALKLSQEKGETYKYLCASSASWVLKQLPGFEVVQQTMLPQNIREDVASIKGVQNFELHENDEGQNYQSANLTVGDPNDTAPPPKPEYGRGEA